jgi:hypothetical protein
MKTNKTKQTLLKGIIRLHSSPQDAWLLLGSREGKQALAEALEAVEASANFARFQAWAEHGRRLRRALYVQHVATAIHAGQAVARMLLARRLKGRLRRAAVKVVDGFVDAQYAALQQ